MSEKLTNKSSSRLGLLSFAIIVFVSAATTLAVILFANFVLEWRFNLSMVDRDHCFEVGGQFWCPIDEPLSDAGLVSVLSSFYTNVIVILIAILALVTTAATIGIRYSARQQIDHELPDLTETFFQSTIGTSKVEGILQKSFEETKSTVEKHDGLINGTLERLDELTDRLNEIDTGESVEAPDDPEE